MPIQADELLGTTPIPPSQLIDDISLGDLNYAQLEFADRLAKGEYIELRKAWVSNLDAPVAIKQNHGERTGTRETIHELYEEGRRASQVCDHPYIVTIHGYGTEPRGWVAMEYLDGGSLDDLREVMSPAERLWTAFAIIDAVEHANSMGISHRDIAPSNILFATTPGQYWPVPKLTDWGQARENHVEELPKEVTENYAAPEFEESVLPNQQLNRADIYQACRVTYELLTGRLPQSYGENVTRPSELASVPRQLDGPLRTGLEFAPSDRLSPGQIRHAFEKAVRENITDLLTEGSGTSTTESTTEDTTGGRLSRNSNRSDSITQKPEDSIAELEGSWPTYRGGPKRTGYVSDAKRGINGLDQRWHFETPAEVRSSVAISNDLAFFGCADGNFYAIDIKTGNLVWNYENDAAFNSSPAVTEDAVYVGSRDRNIYAFDRESGAERWSAEMNMWVDSSPIVHDGTVFVGSNDHRLYAFDAEDGSPVWQYNTGGEIGASSPAVSDDKVYIAGDSGCLSAIDFHAGVERWAFETQFSLPSTPAVDDGVVYVGGSQNRLYAIDAVTGERNWVFHTAGQVRSAPAAWQGVVVFGCDDGSIYTVDEDGNECWSQNLGQRVSGDPTIVGDTVVVGCCDDNVYAFDIRDGEPIDRFDTGGWVTTSPAVAQGRIYVGAERGVFSFKTRG